MDNGLFFDLSRTDARLPQGTIQAGYWRGFKHLVERMGGSHWRILERHDIDPEIFEHHDGLVDCKSALNLLEYCSLRFDDPLFGLHLADLQQPEVFGSIAVVARAAPTFGQSLQCLVDFGPVANSPEGLMELAVGTETSEFRWSSELAGGSCDQAHYHGPLLITKTLRMLGGPRFKPSYVSLGFEPCGALRQEIEQKAGCPLHSGSTSNSIAFSSELLDQANASKNAVLYNLLTDHLERLRETPSESAVENVERFVRMSLPSGNCTIERCADKLGTTPRTLQKHLAICDTSFSMLLEKQRHELAREALAHSRHTIDEIAYNLGYSEQSSFGRAFKRWTGLSPQTFRSRVRSKH